MADGRWQLIFNTHINYDKRNQKQQPTQHPTLCRRWQGASVEQTDKSFVQFNCMAYGYRTAWRILQTYYERFAHQSKGFTVRNIISRWSPFG